MLGVVLAAFCLALSLWIAQGRMRTFAVSGKWSLLPPVCR
jgi:hypothetical protein